GSAPGLRAAVAHPAPRRRRMGTRRGGAKAWLFMAPFVIVNLLVIVGPGIATVYYSLTDWSGVGAAKFVGLENYRELLRDPEFHTALVHNLAYTVIFLTVPIAMGLLGAFLLSRITRFAMVFRVLYFIPYVIASVVNASIWENLLDPFRGLGPELSKIGIPFLDGVSFFGNPDLALSSIAFVDTWHWWGFVAVLFLAAMGAIDRELYDAAKMDGATTWQQFRHVTMPGIRPTFVFIVLMTIIWSFLAFEYIFIITQGGPAGSSEVVSTYMYKEAFEFFHAGFASAAALGMVFVSLAVVAVFFVLRRMGWDI
ncbi:MAG: raffinose/stachyose/melibiose transport system permease protein, partial [Solirubrobacteraceae bacterium]|nr:raffinose/stachyose/melibiose transport system permease protein [Solirubrobacteraceae bacterium]